MGSKLFRILALTNLLIILMVSSARAQGIRIVIQDPVPSKWTTRSIDQIATATGILSGYLANTFKIYVKIHCEPTPGAAATGRPLHFRVNNDTVTLVDTAEITFDTGTINSVNRGTSNIIGLTMHELFHGLGFTNSGAKAFRSRVNKTDTTFTGTVTKKMNNNNPAKLSADMSHFRRGVTWPLNMKPCVTEGASGYPTVLDLAVLADIGYSVPILQGKNTPFLLGFNINGDCGAVAFPQYPLIRGGSVCPYVVGMGSNAYITGAEGNDVMQGGYDIYVQMFGKEGNDVMTNDGGGFVGSNVSFIGDGSTNLSDWPIADTFSNIYNVGLPLADTIYLGPKDTIVLTSFPCGMTQSQIDNAVVTRMSGPWFCFRDPSHNYPYYQYSVTIQNTCSGFFPGGLPGGVGFVVWSEYNPANRSNIIRQMRLDSN